MKLMTINKELNRKILLLPATGFTEFFWLTLQTNFVTFLTVIRIFTDLARFTTLRKNLHIIKKIVLVQTFLILFSISGFASNTGDTEKKGVEKKPEKSEKVNPDKEVPDSLNLLPTKSISRSTASPNTYYKPEQFLEQDSLNQSGSVESFNFIQYIIENFKFSDDVF